MDKKEINFLFKNTEKYRQSYELLVPEEIRNVLSKMKPIKIKKNAVEIKKGQVVQTYSDTPTLSQMSEHFAKSMIKWAGSGFALVDETEYLRRRSICNVCSGGWRCPSCGCLLWAKAQLVTQNCGKSLWGSKVSVIIPVAPHEKKEYILHTIQNLKDNSVLSLEIIIIADGWKPDFLPENVILYSFDTHVGERVTLNKGVEIANGTHIFRLDAHCSMSKNWDFEFVKGCEEKAVCVSVIQGIDENWEIKGGKYTFVSLSPNAQEKWWGSYPENSELECEPTLSFTGCGWGCTKKFYIDNLKLDEDLAKWGALGPEITIKVERAGGCILLCKNIICGHIFQTNKNGYPVYDLYDTQKKLIERYSSFLYQAVMKFKNVPHWDGVENYLENPMKYYKDRV